MILTAGKTNTEQLLGANVSGKAVTSIGVGTSSTPVTATDTALTGAVMKAVTTVNYLTGNVVEFQATLDAGDPAMTINEMGLFNADGILVHRKVITPKDKVAGVSYILIYRVKIV